MTGQIETRARFDFVRYANLWEDADILCEALAPRPGSTMLSIASAGDNCFALLAEGASVIAADLNPAQLAATALKAAAIRTLEREPILGFFGIRAEEPASRVRTYERLRSGLPEEVRIFWDARRPAIEAGFIHDGKFERYFQTFRTKVLPLIHRKKLVADVFRPKPAAERRRFYDEQWDSWRWRLLFTLFFSRFVMGRLGRDPEFFRFVEGSISERLRRRTEYAFTALDPSESPFLSYILLGNYLALPRYLRPEVFPRVKAGLDRLTLRQGSIEQVAKDSGVRFDGFNLSDLFEYIDPETTAGIYGGLLSAARPKARLAYWNMLVPRACPERYRSRIRTLSDLAAVLFARDQAFFYSAFVVDEVT